MGGGAEFLIVVLANLLDNPLSLECRQYLSVERRFLLVAACSVCFARDAAPYSMFLRGSGMRHGDVTPIHEYYDPITGGQLGSPHFSWSAAHILMWAAE